MISRRYIAKVLYHPATKGGANTLLTWKSTSSSLNISTTNVFPLKNSTFLGVPVKVPSTSVDVLIQTYGKEKLLGPPWPQCQLGRYSHKMEQELNGEEITIDCRELKGMFNFTERFWNDVKSGQVK